MHFKGGSTIKDLLVHCKDKYTNLQKSGVIYRCKCGRVDCEEEYIGESGRNFAERFREHMRTPSPIHDHHNTTGHDLSLENFIIVGSDEQSIARSIREPILIRINYPSLNRNIGKYQLAYIWNEVLVKSPKLKIQLKAPQHQGLVTPHDTHLGSITSWNIITNKNILKTSGLVTITPVTIQS